MVLTISILVLYNLCKGNNYFCMITQCPALVLPSRTNIPIFCMAAMSRLYPFQILVTPTFFEFYVLSFLGHGCIFFFERLGYYLRQFIFKINLIQRVFYFFIYNIYHFFHRTAFLIIRNHNQSSNQIKHY